MTVVNNFVGKRKLKLNYVRDRYLIGEVRRIDFGEGASSSSILNTRRILTEIIVGPS